MIQGMGDSKEYAWYSLWDLLDLDVVGKWLQDLEELIECYSVAFVDICFVKQCVRHQLNILQI